MTHTISTTQTIVLPLPGGIGQQKTTTLARSIVRAMEDPAIRAAVEARIAAEKKEDTHAETRV